METEAQRTNRLLLALLKLETQRLAAQEKRPELVLADAGLSYQEIAALLDKKPDAVRMMLARNKGSGRGVDSSK